MNLNEARNLKFTGYVVLFLALVILPPAFAAVCESKLAAPTEKPVSTNSYFALKRATGAAVSTVAASPVLSQWIDLNLNRPVVLNGIKVKTERKDGLFSRDPFLSCGVCHQMSRLHLQATVMPALDFLGHLKRDRHLALDAGAGIKSGKFVLIFVKGELVGAVKLVGAEFYTFDSRGKVTQTSTPTFLALRNVVDTKGRLRLVMGGVYEITRTFYENVVLAEVNRQGPFTNDGNEGFHFSPTQVRKFLLNYQVGAVNVKSLDVYAKTFLLNDMALPENARLFADLFGSFDVHSPTYRVNLWRAILESLEKVRFGLQEEYELDPKLIRLRHELKRYPRPDLWEAEGFDLLEN